MIFYKQHIKKFFKTIFSFILHFFFFIVIFSIFLLNFKNEKIEKIAKKDNLNLGQITLQSDEGVKVDWANIQGKNWKLFLRHFQIDIHALDLIKRRLTIENISLNQGNLILSIQKYLNANTISLAGPKRQKKPPPTLSFFQNSDLYIKHIKIKNFSVFIPEVNFLFPIKEISLSNLGIQNGNYIQGELKIKGVGWDLLVFQNMNRKGIMHLNIFKDRAQALKQDIQLKGDFSFQNAILKLAIKSRRGDLSLNIDKTMNIIAKNYDPKAHFSRDVPIKKINFNLDFGPINRLKFRKLHLNCSFYKNGELYSLEPTIYLEKLFRRKISNRKEPSRNDFLIKLQAVNLQNENQPEEFSFVF